MWAASAVVAMVGSASVAPYVLFLGGMLIFPLTTLGLRLLDGPAGLSKGHPMAGLAFQTAMQVPFGMLVALVLAAVDPRLFFPAVMVIVGAHYLPFVFLYGMRSYLGLGVPMVVGGVLIATLVPGLRGRRVGTVALHLAYAVVSLRRSATGPADVDQPQ